jgi:hypothetical protein
VTLFRFASRNGEQRTIILPFFQKKVFVCAAKKIFHCRLLRRLSGDRAQQGAFSSDSRRARRRKTFQVLSFSLRRQSEGAPRRNPSSLRLRACAGADKLHRTFLRNLWPM